MLQMLTICFRCETLEHTAIKTNLSVLFDRYVPILQVYLTDSVTFFDKYSLLLQDTLSKKFKKITPIPPISHIQVG